LNSAAYSAGDDAVMEMLICGIVYAYGLYDELQKEPERADNGSSYVNQRYAPSSSLLQFDSHHSLF
jgi:hypothetical protein